jgi:hypothetical protein
VIFSHITRRVSRDVPHLSWLSNSILRGENMAKPNLCHGHPYFTHLSTLLFRCSSASHVPCCFHSVPVWSWPKVKWYVIATCRATSATTSSCAKCSFEHSTFATLALLTHASSHIALAHQHCQVHRTQQVTCILPQWTATTQNITTVSHQRDSRQHGFHLHLRHSQFV